MRVKPFCVIWCRSRDLNPDGFSPTAPSRQRVCQFHHFGLISKSMSRLSRLILSLRGLSLGSLLLTLRLSHGGRGHRRRTLLELLLNRAARPLLVTGKQRQCKHHHKEQSTQDSSGLVQESGRLTASENRLGSARAAERTGQAAALAALKKDHHYQKQANNDMNDE